MLNLSELNIYFFSFFHKYNYNIISSQTCCMLYLYNIMEKELKKYLKSNMSTTKYMELLLSGRYSYLHCTYFKVRFWDKQLQHHHQSTYNKNNNNVHRFSTITTSSPITTLPLSTTATQTTSTTIETSWSWAIVLSLERL